MTEKGVIGTPKADSKRCRLGWPISVLELSLRCTYVLKAPCLPAKFAVKSIKSGMLSGRAASPTRSKSSSKSPTFSFSGGWTNWKSLEELKANREKKPMQKRFFPEGKDSKKRPYQDLPLEPLQELRPPRDVHGGQRARLPFPAHSGRQRTRPTPSTWRTRASPSPRPRCWPRSWT